MQYCVRARVTYVAVCLAGVGGEAAYSDSKKSFQIVIIFSLCEIIWLQPSQIIRF